MRRRVESYVREHGINGFYNGLGERLSCCQIRKVEPFKRAIAGYGAWVTGRAARAIRAARRRRSRSCRDAAVPAAQDQPAARLDARADVWTYIRAQQLPYNSPLHDRGYPSIGCAPCTRATEPGQDHRAGRWWWEQPESRECGLHPRPD